MSRLPLRTSLFPYTTLFRSEGMELTQALPWERAEADAIAALGALRAHGAVDESRVGLAGFCYGGGLAFAATASAAEERSAERREGNECRDWLMRDGWQKTAAYKKVAGELKKAYG